MKIAMHQITTRNASMEEDLAAYSAVGWSAFEFQLAKGEGFIEAHSLDSLADRVKDAGMHAVACTGHVVEAFGSDGLQADNLRAFGRALDVMEALNCPVIVFGGDGPDDLQGPPDWSEEGLNARDRELEQARVCFARRVADLSRLAEDRGVTMALEMNWCRLCRSVWSAARVVDLVDRPNVGFLFDAAHFAVSPSRLEDLALVDGRIVHGHLDDMRETAPEAWNVNQDRVIPGDGCLPLADWYVEVEARGYAGWHAAELFCDDLWAEKPTEIARRVMDGCRSVWPRAQF